MKPQRKIAIFFDFIEEKASRTVLDRLENAHIRQQDDVHHQRIDDSGYRHHVVGKDKRTAGNRDSLGSVLHAYFNDDGAYHPSPAG